MATLDKCSVCGMVLDSENDKLHEFYHDIHGDLVLPTHVRDAVRRWATVVLNTTRDVDDSADPELLLTAVDTMKHTWWHRDYRRGITQEEAFIEYDKELLKRFPHLRKL